MIGETISHYKILEKLGEGGMSVVYKAEDLNLKRFVAIKFLPPHLSTDETARMRFIQEAKAASSLEHQNIGVIYEIDQTEEGQMFIVMAFYDGGTLRQRLSRGETNVEEAFDIATQIAAGLAKAHDEGIVHRDIKPANVLFTSDATAKIVDFGLAKLAGQAKITKSGTTVGTIAYMSPEQAKGDEIDERSDIFSLGVVLYELFTGQPPFKGDYDVAVLYEILNSDPEPLATYRSDLPDGLQGVIDKALNKDVNERYPSVLEMLNDLAVLKRGFDSGVQIRPQRVPKSRIVFWRTSALLLVGIIIVTLVWRFTLQGTRETRVEEYALAVMDFRDLATPEDITLSAGITELVNTGLVESCPVRIISFEYLKDLRRRLFGAARGPIEEAQALEVARKSGATLLLSGKIALRGRERYVTWHLVDVKSGNSLGARRVEGSNILRLADQIIADVLPVVARECRVQVPASQQSVGLLTTSSPEAYRHYIAGSLARQQFRTRDALRELEEAVSLDSTFALAIFQLSRTNYSISSGILGIERALAYAERAWERRAHLGIRDRLRLDAWLQTLQHHIPEVKATYNEMLTRWPDDREILGDYCEFLMLHWYLDEAINVSIQGLEHYPDESSFGLVYAAVLACTDRLEEALDASRAYVRQHPDNPNAWDELGSRYLALGLPDSAEAAFRKGLEVNPNFHWCELHIGTCAYVRGDLNKAIEITEAILDRNSLLPFDRVSLTADAQWVPSLTWFYSEAGRFEEALEKFEKIRPLVSDPSVEGFFEQNRAFLLLKSEQAEEVLRISRALAEYNDSVRPIIAMENRGRALVALDSLQAARSAVIKIIASENRRGGWSLFWAQLLTAEIALAEGDPGRAIKSLEEMKRIGFPPGGIFDIQWKDNLSRAHRMAGRLDEAARVLRDMLKICGGHYIAYYELGQIYEEMGSLEDAEKQYIRFLEMWSEADEGLPQMEDAHKRLEALRAGAQF